MGFKVFTSGNLLVVANTTTRRVEKLPKDNCWYEFVDTDAPILYSLYYEDPERKIILNQPYTEFQNESGTVYADDVALQADLDILIGKGASNWGLDVVRGDIIGTSVINKFGENPLINAGAGFNTIWDGGGVYVPPTQPRIHDVASTEAVDTGSLVSSGTATSGSLNLLVDTGATFISDGVAVGDVLLNDDLTEIAIISAIPNETSLTLAGGIRSPWTGLDGTPISTDAYRVVTNGSTGASIMAIIGLGSNLLEQDEFIILNGVNNVATSKTWFRQYRARAFGANATEAVGILTSTAQTDGTVTCQIIDGNNQSLMSIYTVPFDKTGYLTNFWASLSKKTSATSNVILRAGTLDGFGYHIHNRTLNSSGSSGFEYMPTSPLIIPRGVDVWVDADTDSNNTGVSAGFDIILVDNV